MGLAGSRGRWVLWGVFGGSLGVLGGLWELLRGSWGALGGVLERSSPQNDLRGQKTVRGSPLGGWVGA